MVIVWNLQANRIDSCRDIFVQADKNVYCNEHFVVTCERTGLFPRFKDCGVLHSFSMLVESRFEPKQHVKGPQNSKAINHSSPRFSIRPLKMPFYCVSPVELTLNYVLIWYADAMLAALFRGLFWPGRSSSSNAMCRRLRAKLTAPQLGNRAPNLH